MVLAHSATFYSLFDALNSTVSEYSDAVCGQTCGQRAFLDQVQYSLPPPVQKGSFSYSGLGYCTSAWTKKQGVFFKSGVSIFNTHIKNTGQRNSRGCSLFVSSLISSWGKGSQSRSSSNFRCSSFSPKQSQAFRIAS